ncbi:cytochrome P450 [Haematobacter missouriensis]|uniref:Cytochrome P450 n=1 Tax=Haematobacter missouriensis TaxID=366616 RepID=A0ABX3ZW68_9RHOB|nr:cytochrome P450 [Haematobacter missouriensis]KFI26102.1 cytochrome P450 [Haematobacter missouriensis]OWJ78037.1 cytochrome P450 [Haematobacter missouriensis]
MKALRQSPTDPAFVQDPYPFYDRGRAAGPLFLWEDYALPCATGHAEVNALLRDRRFGREPPPGFAPEIPAHLAPFYAVEAHSMLELEPPRHTQLRGLVLRAFTSRRIAALGPEIAALCHDLIDMLPEDRADLLPAFAQKLPVIVIARLLGVPENRADDLLRWSNAMVGMYQAGRTPEMETRAITATEDFVAFLRAHVEKRRAAPADDLLSHLIAAEAAGDRLSTEELISTCILLLNAGHEATVHTLGNALNALVPRGIVPVEETVAPLVEEVMRHDPPLHLFTRWCREEAELFGHRFRPGDQVGCLLAAANRDPKVWPDPTLFDPHRTPGPQLAFGAGIHFCVGAPLARLELQIALPILFARLKGLQFSHPPRYADVYHFHGLEALPVTYERLPR